MDKWDKNNLLPPELPVRKDDESDYTLLRNLRQQSVDPSHPFRCSRIIQAPESIKDFDIINTLHSGDSKSVFLAKKKDTGDQFAVKAVGKAVVFIKNKITLRSKHVVMIHQVDPRFICRIYFAFQSNTKVYLVKELFVEGDSRALISSLGKLDEETTREYVFQLVEGLENLHNQGIIHRDLRPENILIAQGHRLKLTDFGINQKEFLNRNIGGYWEQTVARRANQNFLKTIYYLTPEAILGPDADANIDWWAIGVITYEFLSGVTPFKAEELEVVFQNILFGKINW
ncbi:kinase-like domain-containing protein, partial [Mycena crocata]